MSVHAASSAEVDTGTASNAAASVIDVHNQRVGVHVRATGKVAYTHVDRSISADETTGRSGNIAFVANLKVRGASAGNSVIGIEIDSSTFTNASTRSAPAAVVEIVDLHIKDSANGEAAGGNVEHGVSSNGTSTRPRGATGPLVTDGGKEIVSDRNIGGVDVKSRGRSDGAARRAIAKRVLQISNPERRIMPGREIAGEVKIDRGIGIDQSAIVVLN